MTTKILALDFETFFGKEYTLRKLATSVYIRDRRFKTQCLASMYQGDEYPKIWFGNDVAKFLDSVDWKNTAVVAHHAHFDGLILSHHYKKKPAYWYDTLSMARALHGSDIRADLNTVLQMYGKYGKLNDVLKYTKDVRELDPVLASMLGDYCRGDIIDLLDVAQKMIARFPRSELDKINLLIRLFTEPALGVDRKAAEKELRKEQRQKKKKIRKSGASMEELQSASSFAKLLRERGVKPPTKISKTTEKETYAFAKTDQDFIALLSSEDPEIKSLMEARLAAKSTIGETRAEALLERSQKGMKLPIYLNYAKAHTLRTTGGDKFNPQNFPARQDDSLRRCIVAPKGYRIVVADSAQIEARLNGWQAGQKDLLQAFRDKRDVYAELASKIYGREITKESDPGARFVGKTASLGLGYGMSAPKFQITLALGLMGPPVFLEMDLCQKAVTTYRAANHKIVATWQKFDNMIAAMLHGQTVEHRCLRFVKDGIQMPNGLTLRYPGLRLVVDKETGYQNWVYGKDARTIYGQKLVENVVQSLAYIVVSDQMLKVAVRYKVVMFTHDEIVFLAKTREADKALAWAIDVMRKPPVWAPDLPLEAEGFHDDRYHK